jgi:hypothetical protein
MTCKSPWGRFAGWRLARRLRTLVHGPRTERKTAGSIRCQHIYRTARTYRTGAGRGGGTRRIGLALWGAEGWSRERKRTAIRCYPRRLASFVQRCIERILCTLCPLAKIRGCLSANSRRFNGVIRTDPCCTLLFPNAGGSDTFAPRDGCSALSSFGRHCLDSSKGHRGHLGRAYSVLAGAGDVLRTSV